MRRIGLGIMLSALLAGAPLWATGVQAETQHGTQILLLFPADNVNDFQQGLPSELRTDITIAPSQTISMEGKSYSLVWVDRDRLNDLRQALSGKPYEKDMKIVFVGDLDSMSAQAAAGATSTPGKEQTSFQASTQAQSTQMAQASPAPGAGASSGTIYTWQGKDVILIPHDQAQSFDRATAGGREIMVIVPHERYVAIAQPGAASSTGSTAAVGPFPGFDKKHVLLLVPADQLDKVSQLSTGDRQVFVVMPLEQFNQLADAKKLTESSTAAVAPSREPTAYQAPAAGAAQAYSPEPGRRFFLHSLGEANAVLEIEPAAGGTFVRLRDGSTLMVPDSAMTEGTLREGARVRGEFEQRNGQNLVTWLQVVPQGAESSTSDSGSQ